jgi:hypothetical protein
MFLKSNILSVKKLNCNKFEVLIDLFFFERESWYIGLTGCEFTIVCLLSGVLELKARTAIPGSKVFIRHPRIGQDLIP